MQYRKPELKVLGTLSSLTLGQNGSCPDGAALNNTQLGGGLKPGCGKSGSNNKKGKGHGRRW